MIIILFGVSGSGKTTIGNILSGAIKAEFIEGDNFHSQQNIMNMKNGIPLGDTERSDWLISLNHELIKRTECNKSVNIVMACSALKKKYRDVLKKELSQSVLFVFLKGDYDLIFKRISERKDHFMKSNMLKSQFEALEEPNEKEESFIVDVSKNGIDDIVGMVLKQIELKKKTLK